MIGLLAAISVLCIADTLDGTLLMLSADMCNGTHPLHGLKKLSLHDRKDESKAMVQRITDEVNSTLAQEPGQVKLSPEAVLDLIDLGASPGGPEVTAPVSALQ